MPLPALIIIAQQGFQDVELAGTRKGLLEAGFDVVLGSSEAGECTGKLEGREQAQVALRDVRIPDYDRVAFIGGPGARVLADDAEARRIARETVAAGKTLGAICIAPTILAAAGVLRGKRATVWNTDGAQEGFFREHGATYTGEPVTVDGSIVTGSGPQAAEEFGRTFAALS